MNVCKACEFFHCWSHTNPTRKALIWSISNKLKYDLTNPSHVQNWRQFSSKIMLLDIKHHSFNKGSVLFSSLKKYWNPAVDYQWVTTQKVTTEHPPLHLWSLVFFPTAPPLVKKCVTHLDSDRQRASPIASCPPCFSEGASFFPNLFCGPMSQVWTKSKRFVTLPIWRVRLTVLRKSFVCPCQRLNCGKLLPMGEVKGSPPLLQSCVPSLRIYPFPTHCPILRCEVKRWPPPSD